jgi:hypothetical protein
MSTVTGCRELALAEQLPLLRFGGWNSNYNPTPSKEKIIIKIYFSLTM